MAASQPVLEALGDHDYLLRFTQDYDARGGARVCRSTVVAQIAADETRVVAATADYLIARQSLKDLPEQVDLDEVAAAYDDYVDDLHNRLNPPT